MNRWISGARPRTLPAAVVPVAVGAACAVGVGEPVWWRAGVALVVSLALQVGVNYANDYSDGIRGTDDARVGPLRLVASGAARPEAVRAAAFAALGIAAVAGAVLAVTVSWWLLVVGACAIAAAWLYTGGPSPYGYLGLGEVFVFVFFGLVATGGTTFVVAEQLPALSIVMGCGVGCLACALLVINNLRDIPTDAEVGKRTLAVRLGAGRTRQLYVALVAAAFALAVVAAAWRWPSLLALVALPIAVPPVRIVLGAATGRELIAALAGTGRLQLGYGVAAAAGLALGG